MYHIVPASTCRTTSSCLRLCVCASACDLPACTASPLTWCDMVGPRGRGPVHGDSSLNTVETVILTAKTRWCEQMQPVTVQQQGACVSLENHALQWVECELAFTFVSMSFVPPWCAMKRCTQVIPRLFTKNNTRWMHVHVKKNIGRMCYSQHSSIDLLHCIHRRPWQHLRDSATHVNCSERRSCPCSRPLPTSLSSPKSSWHIWSQWFVRARIRMASLNENGKTSRVRKDHFCGGSAYH